DGPAAACGPARGEEPRRGRSDRGVARRSSGRDRPAREPRRRRVLVDVVRRQPIPQRSQVRSRVAEDVYERAPDLRWRAERSRVVAVGEDRALALHEAIEALRHADGHALDGAGERAGVARLDDEVDVVVLDGELGHTRVEPDARGEERALEDAKAPAAAELPHVLFHPKGDVQGEARVDAPGEVRYARIWLARPPQA